MKLIELHLRSRLTLYALVGLLAVLLLGWIVGRILLQFVPFIQRDDIFLVPVYLWVPLACAVILGVSTHSPFGDLEFPASYPVPVLRFLHLFGMFLFCSLGLLAISTQFDVPYSGLTLIRNLAGIAGFTFLTARVLGSGLSWTLPLVFGVAAQMMGRGHDGELYRWAWSMWPISDPLSALIAMVLFAVGLGTVSLSGARESLLERIDA